jgi:hypothetical protein
MIPWVGGKELFFQVLALDNEDQDFTGFGELSDASIVPWLLS